MPVMPLPPSEVHASKARPARMAPLAKLPVFIGLEGRRVVLAGGGDGAAWKAELLLACGAQVNLYCPAEEMGEAMAELMAFDGAGDARLIHHAHPWHVGIFPGAALALADCETEDEGQAFACAARAAGVPVNVIDKPDHCSFQFGSIVNRSPVVVSISTDGAAPILAQAIRQRIETLLPPGLKSWGEAARAMRDAVAEKLQPGPARRRFWERVVDRAFTPAPTSREEAVARLAEDLQATGPADAAGRVTLVGAGPGDAELLTLKAMRALQSADIILFDDLVSAEVLELARREAKRMLVGKRGGRESCRQEDINDLMVRFAKAGKHVVRLKSGDPMIFGRAGEEIARLQREGIAVEVVPGITAASAMASRLKVSLTHRDHAQSVRFVTGHSRKGVLPDTLDWSGLADPTTSTVYYMGGRTAGAIAERLMEKGMSGGTPAVIMRAVTRETEQRWIGELADMPGAMAAIGVDEPVLIGIGAAFAEAKRDIDTSGAAHPEASLRRTA
ncbi:uroporphyrinogen-III C-methyltransferase [Xaviernesmea oryzae]|uniref:Uroporphyrinogen-III C-methyltransferase n=1 Tax=Xaviernesmea oryzae TaxID=464029 RepID=A0A1Q9AXV4_9HYPH|nr:siroheme synthase CysG [Xaviernesmea oryzae]OLP60271.1 uroporphyrinogen-III C-methyltransferase [Xaviernesmea oryzae]SEK25490.1 uroporphyrin-III C-methyltransferase / precorrin-2 dehydrogenase / sirohydrochlorin ferrochelatase [Xaviernesmea oryzae]